VGIILVVPIVLMNLVTAVIVNIAIEQAEHDRGDKQKEKDEKHRKCIQELARMFVDLDEDKSGKVSKDEFISISAQDKKMLSSMTNVDDPMKVFNALDVNMEGEIGISEFCEGIWAVASSSTSLDMKRMEIQVDHMYKTLQKLELEQTAQRKALEKGLRREQTSWQTSFRESLDSFETSFLRKISGDDGTPRLLTPRGAAGEPATRVSDVLAAGSPPQLPPEEQLACGFRQVCIFDEAKPGWAAAEAPPAQPPLDDKRLLTSKGVVDTTLLEQEHGRAIDPSIRASILEVAHKHTGQLLADMAASTRLHAQRLQTIEQEVFAVRLRGASDMLSGDLFRIRKPQPRSASQGPSVLPPSDAPADGRGIECPPPTFAPSFRSSGGLGLATAVGGPSPDIVLPPPVPAAPDLETNAVEQGLAGSAVELSRSRGTKKAI